MKTTRNCLLWIPALVWYRLIWNFSAQPAAVSGDLSDRLLGRLLALFSPAFSAGDGPVQTAAVELLSFFERKAAHMFLYFILILLLWLALAPLLRSTGRQLSAAALLCGALAALDEYHQTMVPGRSGQMRDVLIDLSGAALAVALAMLLRWCIHRRAAGTSGRRALLFLVPGLLSATAIALFPFPQRFVPVSAGLPGADLVPVLREVCLLASCALLGFCAALAAALGLRRLPLAIGVSALGAGLLSTAAALPLDISLPPSAAVAALLGCGLFWCFCAVARAVIVTTGKRGE